MAYKLLGVKKKSIDFQVYELIRIIEMYGKLVNSYD